MGWTKGDTIKPKADKADKTDATTAGDDVERLRAALGQSAHQARAFKADILRLEAELEKAKAPGRVRVGPIVEGGLIAAPVPDEEHRMLEAECRLLHGQCKKFEAEFVRLGYGREAIRRILEG